MSVLRSKPPAGLRSRSAPWFPAAGRFFLLCIGLSALAVFTNPHTAHCQGLADAIETRLTLPGGGYVRHCRRAEGGCRARAERLAELFLEAGERYGVDPWLLAAMAAKESGMDSSAVGRVGELGLMQLHPRSPWGRRALRRVRAGEPADAVVVDEAAALLAAAIARCTEIDAALGAYNSGRCGPNRYAERVLRIRAAMEGTPRP